MQRTETKRPSAFDDVGIKKTVAGLLEEIQALYLGDSVPWVVGYSGGKDSTATLQLVWMALAELPAEQRTKTVHVISTDTLVENPVVAAWVTQSLDTMRESASRAGMPIRPNRLTPAVSDTFWVNLIGKGYPAPRPKFRWCTERLKIRPSNAFISKVVRQNGEVILVLGTRKAESAARAKSMERHERRRVRERLSPNASLPNSLIYSPIEDWSNDDVWMFLMQYPNPWGYRNKDLLTMYQGASADGECPLVVDSSTPSCGDSRFGCWVCTLVDKDKSMQAMIQNDEEKEWMLPLLELRNELDLTDDRPLRDFRRMNGALTLHNNQLVHGPYKQEARERWLRRVLEAQRLVRRNGPEHVRKIELITLEELQEIRRIWVVEKHEIEDSLPRIYAEATEEPYPGRTFEDGLTFSPEDIALLREICGEDSTRFELARELLDIERRHRSMAKRSGLFDALEDSIKKRFFTSAEDAASYALSRQAEREQIQALREPQPTPEHPKRAESQGPKKTKSEQLPLIPDDATESSADAPDRAV
ncbi:MAG TPA: DNA phosphorothioation system sulfurtransferase DndC [Myxococcaceae bacterium]|jgi:DNA sulfur modification protein DndC